MNSCNIKEKVLLGIVSVIVGVITGVLTSFFGQVLLKVSELRVEYFGYLIPFLAIVGFLFHTVYLKYGKNAVEGMNIVFRIGQGEDNRISKWLIPFMMIGTWLAHLFGASVGREGVAVQLGATVANQFQQWFSSKRNRQILLMIGMASGFAGLFGTPLAATFFAIEVMIVGQLQIDALFYALLSSFISMNVAQRLGLEKFMVGVPVDIQFDETLLKMVVLGIAFGLTGRLFSVSLAYLKKYWSTKIPSTTLRLFLLGIAVSILIAALGSGRYAGLGTNLIHASFYNETIYVQDWILKLGLTVFSLSAGFLGGEVTPLFAIGSSLGIVMSSWLGISPMVAAALGYGAVFGSATNTWLAPIFIIGEVFGYSMMPYAAIVCIVAFVVNGNNSIYGQQKIFELEGIER